MPAYHFSNETQNVIHTAVECGGVVHKTTSLKPTKKAKTNPAL